MTSVSKFVNNLGNFIYFFYNLGNFKSSIKETMCDLFQQNSKNPTKLEYHLI